MAAGAKVYQISRWKQFRYLLRTWLPSILFGLALIGFFAFALFIGPQMSFRDIKDRPLQQGTGLITFVNYGVSGQDGSIYPNQATIEIDNTWVTYSYSNQLKKLWKGQYVRVSYRIGKSGRVYVEDVEPVGVAQK